MSRLLTARERLEAVLAPELVEAVEALVDERVNQVLANVENGSSSPWLSIAEAAAYLKLSERKLHALIARGRLRSSTIGRRRLLHRDDLDALMEEATGEDVAPTTPPRRRGE